MAKTTGGAIMASMLKQENIEKIFGIIDGTYGALYINTTQQGIELVSPRHETTAVHMAGAYARLTGKLGVCFASNGPGTANALSGVAVENLEGNRVLLITSCRRNPISYPDRGGTYQCFDQVGTIRGMAKWSQNVPSQDRLPEIMHKALRACYEGRPGVVHIDVPENFINGDAEPVEFLSPAQYRRLDPIEPSPNLVDQAAKMLTEARLPIIHAGSGVVHALAFEEITELAEILHAPVSTSWAARGLLPESHSLAWPMIHMKANDSLRNATDLVLCLGSRLGETDWWGKAPYWALPSAQKFIQVDIDEQNIGRNRRVDLAVLADVKIFMQRLISTLKELDAPNIETRKTEAASLATEKDKNRQKLDKHLEDKSSPLITAHVANVCLEVFEDDAILIVDGGNSAVWASFFHEIKKPNTFLSTFHMGHLGAGLGQAIGAAAAFPERQIYCIIGDGAMGFHPQEVETAVRNKMPIIFLVCCDKQWGMVKINQNFALKPVKTMLKKSLNADENINTDFHEIEFDKLAQAMGAHGERINDPAELKPALERCLATGICSVIHVDVDPVKHIWAPGLLKFKEMHQEPKGK